MENNIICIPNLYFSYIIIVYRLDLLVTVLDRYISRIQETGLLERWHRTLVEDYRRSQGLPPVQISPEEDALRPLSLEDTQGPFIAAALGLGSATVVFFVEILSVVVKRKGTN